MSSSPVRERRSVVLPAPLAPRSAMIEPTGIWMLAPRSDSITSSYTTSRLRTASKRNSSSLSSVNQQCLARHTGVNRTVGSDKLALRFPLGFGGCHVRVLDATPAGRVGPDQESVNAVSWFQEYAGFIVVGLLVIVLPLAAKYGRRFARRYQEKLIAENGPAKADAATKKI